MPIPEQDECACPKALSVAQKEERSSSDRSDYIAARAHYIDTQTNETPRLRPKFTSNADYMRWKRMVKLSS